MVVTEVHLCHSGFTLPNVHPFFQILQSQNPYQASKENFLDFVDVVMAQIRVNDITIRNVPAKEAMFRINRDIRFSTDKTPYKTNFSAAFSTSGKKVRICFGYPAAVIDTSSKNAVFHARY